MNRQLRLHDMNNYHRAHKKNKCNLKRRNRKYNKFRGKVENNTVGSNCIIKAPKVLSVLDWDTPQTLSPTLKFKEQIDKLVGLKKCILDFSDVIHFSASAQLLVYSSVQLAIKKYGEYAEKTQIAWSDKAFINKVIRRMPLDKLCKQQGNLGIDFTDNRNRLQIVYGTSNQHIDNIIEFIQKWVYNNNMDSETEYRFGDAISETINNVSSHAYPELNLDEKKWWLICDVFGDQLYLAIYDAGVGIPATVVRKKWFWQNCKDTYPELIKDMQDLYPEDKLQLSFFKKTKIKDAQLINLSMKGDVSGTKVDKRGQGSKSIRAFVEDTTSGKLQICSSKGLYIFENEDKDVNLYELEKEVPGTLIQWNIKINAN